MKNSFYILSLMALVCGVRVVTAQAPEAAYDTVGSHEIGISFLAQQASPWTKWSWLIGEWKGVGGGDEPGMGSGRFTFALDLEKKILVRRAHSEYPATANKPLIIHDDLLIVYLDASGNPTRAIYFDNEGKTINYSLSYADKSVVFLSDRVANTPIFRLTYTLQQDGTVNVKFEMSQDGKSFKTYVEGRCRKVA